MNTEFPNFESQQQLPPMLRQYCEYKSKYTDTLILMQVGDFYEAFFNDAVVLSKELNLTLTSRDKNSENPIPMAGMPQSVIDNYTNRLLQKGLSVAIISQDGSGKAVSRFLDKVITPGVPLAATSSDIDVSFLLTLYYEENLICLAYSNLISGDIYHEEFTDWNAALNRIVWIDPKEIIVPRVINDIVIDSKKRWVKDLEKRFKHIKFRAVRNSRNSYNLAGYVSTSNQAKKTIQLLISYVDEVTIEKNIIFKAIHNNLNENTLIIDSRTRSNLELVANQKDSSTQGTLYGWLNHTKTSGGSRLLKNWIINPRKDENEIKARYDQLEEIITFKDKLSYFLSQISDLEKIATRIDLDYANPIEIVGLRNSLRIIPEINNITKYNFDECKEVLELIEYYLQEEPGLSIKSGNVINASCDPELTRLRNLKKDGANWVIKFESEQKELTNINNLKVKYTEIHGYFIEIGKNHLDKVPVNYIKKQSTLNADKFTTSELKTFENDILSADQKAVEIEKKYFKELLVKLKDYSFRIKEISFEISRLDVINSFAIVTNKYNLVRPVIGKGLKIVSGKHPILLEKLGMNFIPNDLNLSDQMLAILVGPNMGGKSTYLRQTGLLIVLAQIGCFVPVQTMEFKPVNQLFARIGATDDIHEGESTFMVEMREASYILENANSDSLILIDELGRGTATKDGMSLAQAILEELISRRTRTLFATHYHELTEIKSDYLQNLTVGCEEKDQEIFFTHKINSGKSNRSYGYEVAKLAGISLPIITRAKNIAGTFTTQKGEQMQLLFEEIKEPSYISEIKTLNLNSITPLEALNFLQKIKNEINS